jgi:hypothetical protein
LKGFSFFSHYKNNFYNLIQRISQFFFIKDIEYYGYYIIKLTSHEQIIKFMKSIYKIINSFLNEDLIIIKKYIKYLTTKIEFIFN